ncbi:hypothetical protein ACM614_01580, partial [Streptomyces sp. 12297]
MRSGYLRQVERIAPPELGGREPELAGRAWSGCTPGPTDTARRAGTARGISNHDERSQALAAVVSALVSLGDTVRAGELVAEVPGPRERAQALRQLAADA